MGPAGSTCRLGDTRRCRARRARCGTRCSPQSRGQGRCTLCQLAALARRHCGHGLAAVAKRHQHLPSLRPVRRPQKHRLWRGPVGHSARMGASADWLIVGEAPGENEDAQGEPFVGEAGKLLDNMLRAMRVDGQPLDRQQQRVYFQRVKCRPVADRNPSSAEVAMCQPYLQRQIALLQPKIILAMGRFAVQALTGSTEPLGKLRGRVHTLHGSSYAVPVIVTYHPAYLLRNLPDKAKAWADLLLAMEKFRYKNNSAPAVIYWSRRRKCLKYGHLLPLLVTLHWVPRLPALATRVGDPPFAPLPSPHAALALGGHTALRIATQPTTASSKIDAASTRAGATAHCQWPPPSAPWPSSLANAAPRPGWQPR